FLVRRFVSAFGSPFQRALAALSQFRITLTVLLFSKHGTKLRNRVWIGPRTVTQYPYIPITPGRSGSARGSCQQSISAACRDRSRYCRFSDRGISAAAAPSSAGGRAVPRRQSPGLPASNRTRQ